MARFIFLKFFRLITLLFVVSLLTFILVSMSPIDPIRAYIGADMLLVSAEQRELIEAYWGIKSIHLYSVLSLDYKPSYW